MAANSFIFNFDMIKINRQITTFFLKLCLLFIIVCGLDFIIGGILRRFYFTQQSGFQYRMTYALEKTKDDILVFGASEANHHYVPSIFERNLKLSCYNAGQGGQSILYHFAVFKSVFERHIPKVIILDFSISNFNKNKDSYEKLSALLPYYKTRQKLRPIIELKSKFEKIKLFSSIYPFNSSILTIIIGNCELNKKRHKDILGYVPLYKKRASSLRELKANEENKGLDLIKINLFERFISDAILSGVRVYVVVSPRPVKFRSFPLELKIAGLITSKYGIQLWDYSQDQFFLNHTEMFNDTVHLNNIGAETFSKIIAMRIKNEQK